MKRRLLAAGALLWMLAGCATMETQGLYASPGLYTLRFVSEPSGALVYDPAGKVIGMTPMERSVILSPQQQMNDEMVDVALVVWPSGASSQHTLRFWPRQNKVWTFTLNRPANAPGLDVDLRHAMLQQQQLRRNQAADVSNLLGSFIGAYTAGRYQAAAPVQLQAPTSIRCTTREVGWSLVTDCR